MIPRPEEQTNDKHAPTLEPERLPPHLARLPGEQWAVWRWAGLRGAGFPANSVLKLADAACARTADETIDAEAEAEQALALALGAVNAALDDLRASQGWDDPDRRAPLLKLLRGLKKGDLPQQTPVPPAVAEALAALQAARARAETARAAFALAFETAIQSISQAISDIAGDDRFREALVWQNRRALHTGIASLQTASQRAGRGSQRRQHEEMVANYLQRYCVKNDTIGFFGPVGWARFTPCDEAIRVRPGPSLLRVRNVYFEQWAVDGVAAALAKTSVLRPWFAPRRLPFFDLCGTTLYWPAKRPLRVSAAQAAVLAACTGARTAQTIAAELGGEAEVYKLLDQLRNLGVITWTLEVPFAGHPERALRRLLERIDEPRLRRSALAPLDELEQLRDEVVRATGSAEDLDQALDALERAFTRLTDAQATRKAGATYAGRTLVYEDCQRDIEIELGPSLLDELGPALSLLLASARWYTYQTGALYRVALDEIYNDLARQTGSPEVEMVAFWQQAQSRLHNEQPHLALAVMRMFQERWADVLAIPEGQRQVAYTSDELGPRVAQAFAAPAPGWQSARYHSPDVMIASSSPEAIRQGDYQLVMGELHLAANTLRGSLFVNQHPAPGELLAALECDLPDPQVVPIAPRNWPEITSRTRSEFITDRDFRLAFTFDAAGHNHPRLLTIGGLIVVKHGTRLVVRTRDGRHQFDIVEFFSEIMMMDIVDGFKIFGAHSHTPRVTIDRLVVSRETWRVAPRALPFANDKSEAGRFLGARRWARENGLPRQVFVKSPIERKPFYVDFDSPILVNILAKTARRMAEQDAAESLLTITEMCPALDQTWLPDADGQAYTSELRIVAVDQRC
ncbi:MAG TPA: lantibiotic dehydratase [Herpetosiphonaceae bacterium]